MSEFWKAEYFESAPLPYLPLKHVIRDRKFTVSRLAHAQVDAVFALAQTAAGNLDNVGSEEFPDIDTFREELSDREAFCVTDENDVIVGALFIGNCIMSRNVDSALAQFDIFLTHALFRGGFHKDFVFLCERLTRDLKLGFFMAFILIFEHNAETIMDLRRHGYQECLALPFGGRLKKLGPQITWMLVKKIDEERELRPMSEIVSMLKRCVVAEPDMNPPRHPALPCQLYFRPKGIYTTLRWTQPAEYRAIYDLFKDAMAGGDGYTEDELLTYDMFLTYQINGKYAAVLEENETGNILGFLSIGVYHRIKGVSPEVADASVVINPRHRGLGITTELGAIWPPFVKHIGFDYMIGDTALPNRAMRTIEQRLGYKTVGAVPCGMHMTGIGWTDTVLSINDLRNLPSFPEIAARSQQRGEEARRKQSKI